MNQMSVSEVWARLEQWDSGANCSLISKVALVRQTDGYTRVDLMVTLGSADRIISWIRSIEHKKLGYSHVFCRLSVPYHARRRQRCPSPTANNSRVVPSVEVFDDFSDTESDSAEHGSLTSGREEEYSFKRSEQEHVCPGLVNRRMPDPPSRFQTQLRLATWNICGVGNKRQELEGFMQRRAIDIAALQETLTREEGWPLRLRGFSCHNVAATGGHKRGVSLLVRKGIAHTVIKMDPHTIWIRVACSTMKSLHIAGTYIPSGTRRESRPIIKSLAKTAITLKEKGSEILILGDFNMVAQNMLRELLAAGLGSMHRAIFRGNDKTFHRRGRNWSSIDYLLYSEGIVGRTSNALVDRTEDLSDHFPVCAKLNWQIPNSSVESSRVRFNATQVLEKSEEILSAPGWKQLLEQTTEAAAVNWQNTTTQVLKACEVESRPKCGNNGRRIQTYRLSQRTRGLIRKKKTAFGFFLRSPASQTLLQNYLEAKRSAKMALKKESKVHWLKYVHNGVNFLRKGDPRAFWKWVKSLTNSGAVSHGTGSVIKDRNGRILVDPRDVLDRWRAHFASLAEDVSGNSSCKAYWLTKGNLAIQEPLTGLNDVITWGEVNRILKTLKANKSPGDDGIPYEVLKLSSENEPGQVPNTDLGRTILKVMQEVFDSGVIPTEWQESIVVPIFKKGDYFSCDNYRGISLMNVILKLLCTVVNRRIYRQLENSERLSKAQAGFREKEETMSHVCALYEIVQRRQLRKKKTYLAFLDIKKAFDTVPHGALFVKLERIGVTGKALNFIESLYRGSTMRVVVGGLVSEPFPLQRGVRQGCPLSPVLFDIFIDDILDQLRGKGVAVQGIDYKIPGLAFADDLALIASKASRLSDMLGIADNWGMEWEMCFGIPKCGIIPIGASRATVQNPDAHPATWNWTLQGEKVPIVLEYEYLGVPIHLDMDVERVEKHRTQKVVKALGSVAHVLKNGSIPFSAKISIYKTLVLSAAMYGGELTGMNSQRSSKIERILMVGLGWVFGCKGNKPPCRLTMLEEARCAPFAAIRSAQKARALVKWKRSRTYIADLIKNTNLGFSKRTWATGGHRWLANPRWGPDVWRQGSRDSLDHRKVFKEVKRRSWARQRRRKNQSESFKAYGKYNLKRSSWDLGKIVEEFPANTLSLVARMRVGGFWTARRLAVAGLIDSEWRNRCPCCRDPVPETLSHFLLYCPRFVIQRAEHLVRSLDSVQEGNARADPRKLVHILLGGKEDGGRCLPVMPRSGDRSDSGTQARTNSWLTGICRFIEDTYVERCSLVFGPSRPRGRRN